MSGESILREAKESAERIKEAKELVKKVYELIQVDRAETEVNGWQAGVIGNIMYARKREGEQLKFFQAYIAVDGEVYLTIENTNVIEALNIILEAVRRVL